MLYDLGKKTNLQYCRYYNYFVFVLLKVNPLLILPKFVDIDDMIDSTVDSNGYSMVTPPGTGAASRNNPFPISSGSVQSSGTHNPNHPIRGESTTTKEDKLEDEEEFVQSSHYEDSSNDNTNDYSLNYGGNLNTSKDSNSNSAQISTSGQVKFSAQNIFIGP